MPKVSGLVREYSRFAETIDRDGFDHDCRPTLALCLNRFSGPNRPKSGVFLLNCRATTIEQRARALGMRPAHFGRATLLSQKQIVVSTAEADTLKRLIHQQLSRLGNNLNQLVRLCTLPEIHCQRILSLYSVRPPLSMTLHEMISEKFQMQIHCRGPEAKHLEDSRVRQHQKALIARLGLPPTLR